MRQALGILVATLALAVGVTASPVAAHTSQSACKAGYYKNVSGNCVKSPTAAKSVPAGATAKCRDATYSFSQHASGTCSHHGGVAVWIHHP
jgi:Protein of unknown function (DUF3761)